MRLFVALSIPPEAQNNLATLLNELRPLLPEIRWTPVKNIHLTLKFLGEISDDSVAAICGALKKVKQEKLISLHSIGLDSFVGRGKERVLFAKIIKSTQLAELASEIGTRLETAGILQETRPFVPHLTLGRGTNGRLPKNLDEILERFEPREFANFPCGEFHLFASKLKPAGAEYTILQSFSFATEPRI